MNFLELYDLEKYLFDTVSPAFHKQGKLKVFDFFCIIIWKANRAKSKIAERLKKMANPEADLNVIVEEITAQVFWAQDNRDKMRVLIEGWRFRLPMASAILSVLYPDEFTVYDVRVCDVLRGFHDVQGWKFDNLWPGYQDYLKAVQGQVPGVCLRDKDRTLWGESFARSLETDIEKSFPIKAKKKTTDDEP